MTTNNSSTTGAQLDEKQIFDLAEAEDAKLRAKAGKSYPRVPWSASGSSATRQR